MAALVYRVSCDSRGDQWFADGVEAEAAAQEILRGGEAVSLFPVPVPETARDFVGFMERQRKPRSLSAATAEALNRRFGLLARDREVPSAELQVAAAILGVFIEKRLQEHEIIAALEAVRCDTAETRAAVSRTFGRAVKAPERCPDAASCDRGCEVRHFVGEEVPGACRQRRAGADAYEITEDEILASSAKHFVRRERDPVSGEIVTRSLVQDR